MVKFSFSHTNTNKSTTTKKISNLSGRTSACCFGTMLDLVSEVSTAGLREKKKKYYAEINLKQNNLNSKVIKYKQNL